MSTQRTTQNMVIPDRGSARPTSPPHPCIRHAFPRHSLLVTRYFPSGFTLMEMMVALSIMIFIMLGVAVVFANVSQAMRMALSNSYTIRAKLDIARTLKSDLENISPDGFLVLANMRALAFQDPAERDDNGNLPFTGNTSDPAHCYHEVLNQNPTNKGIGKRWYRSDLLTFCTTGYFKDQMGAIGNNRMLYQQPGVASYEAWVTWGNAAVDVDVNNQVVNMTNNDLTVGNWQPNNLANEWALARRIVLLPGKVPALYLQNNINPKPYGMSYFTSANLTDTMTNAISANKTADTVAHASTDVGMIGLSDLLSSNQTFEASSAHYLLYRPRATLQAAGMPPSREDVARTSVLLAGGVSDFSVEFAGDYLNQNTATNTTQWVAGQDGEVDYYYWWMRQSHNAFAEIYEGKLPPDQSKSTAWGPYVIRKSTVWYGLHSTQQEATGRLLWVPPAQPGTNNGMSLSACVSGSGNWPYNVTLLQPSPPTPMPEASKDTSGLYGPKASNNDSRLEIFLRAAFTRSSPHLWPRMLRITYRVHSGSPNEDAGQLIQTVIRLPTAR